MCFMSLIITLWYCEFHVPEPIYIPCMRLCMYLILLHLILLHLINIRVLAHFHSIVLKGKMWIELRARNIKILNPIYISCPNSIYISRPNPIYISRPNLIYISRLNPIYISRLNPIYISRPNPIYISGTKFKFRVRIWFTFASVPNLHFAIVFDYNLHFASKPNLHFRVRIQFTRTQFTFRVRIQSNLHFASEPNLHFRNLI